MGIHPGEAPAPDYWDRVEAVFTAALATEVSARTAVLDAGCEGRADLRSEVEALLAAHDRAGDFITPLPVGEARPAPEACAPGTRIGAFRLTEWIAHGGMGDVYRAERVEGDFTQQVAIKLIAGRLQGADTVRRFRDERQILASLQHPNIVTLVDGGVTTDGQPYIAMEYVDGLTITEFCRQQPVGIEARLALFQQVCAAVGFAHRHLVVHRDLKPGNVLVTRDGAAKVLDFGVAKLLEPRAVASGTTLSLVGPMTPNYASPEQVRGLPVTTAADIYALGVLLYEVMAGQRPYETAGKPLEEVLSIVVQQEPQRPSERCAADLPYEGRRIRGDLDAVVLKAMAKDPAERYASAEELRDDLARVLAGQPVVAREPSFAYLARKAIARHRAAFAVGAALMALLVVALAGVSWQARVAHTERRRAEARFRDVRQLANSVLYELHDAIAPLSGATPARRILVARALGYLDRLAGEAPDDRSLQRELADGYQRIAQIQGGAMGANLGDTEGALRSHSKALAIRQALAGRRPADPADEAALALAEFELGALLRGMGQLDQAEQSLRSAATRLDALASTGTLPDAPRRRLAIVYQRLADLYSFRGRQEEAITWARKAVAEAESLWRATPGDPSSRSALASASYEFAKALAGQDQYAEALERVRQARALLEAGLRDNPVDARQTQVLLFVLYAEGLYCWRLGDLPGAVAVREHALEVAEDALRTDPSDRWSQMGVAVAAGALGEVVLATGDAKRAVRLFRQALAISSRAVAEDPQYAFARLQVASGEHGLGRALLAEDTAPSLAEGCAALERVRVYWSGLQSRDELPPGETGGLQQLPRWLARCASIAAR
jgi:non-specific serine/threonine protein kinase/serine/threonine-protein kinase